MNALLIIDIQNDFLPGGPLGVPEADLVIPLINELMPAYPLVVATQDYHPPEHGSFAANHKGGRVGELIDLDGLPQVLWPTHCVAGTKGADFAKELWTDRVDHIFRKGGDSMVDSYSGFFDNGHRSSTGLADYLREKGVTVVDVVGVATDYCVKFTALDAIREGFQVRLIKDACRGVDLASGDVERAIGEMKGAGVEITEVAEVLEETVILFRPVGPNELALVEASGFTKWPPRLPEQPIFYPVTNEAYAEQIARDWNVPASGSAAVTRFEVRRRFLKNYSRKVVGSRRCEEYWIPAEDLDAMNAEIVGKIEIVRNLEPQLG